ncbi:efflux RND transporter periplasmic adaptor subunit [Thioalkalivibrio sp. XN8]|uniref:efflux RND transporter periplasmic adaptor subunit n=1 Tax=Thioalkalivibrio sp. XN8 TaxID=2712863 RepID=UPI001F0E687E|nr:efflux RND transporter periplasmic adaptor subunit [Thioalkalivibrio sp. XN8]
MPPAPVTVQEVTTRSVVVEADYTGRVRGLRQAEVRARVGGILETRLYEEGEEVAAGAPLFQVDPAPFRIAVQRAEAALANARAELNQAQREWRRVSRLFEQGVASERERDLALSVRELAEAGLAQAEAGLAQAELELGYATVRAPVAGFTGLEAVTPGNLIAAGDLLTTVTQLDPVQVRFSLPADAAAARRALARTGAGADQETLQLTLVQRGAPPYPEPGRMDFLASTVDPATGNVMAQAVFPNPERILRPGETVRVRLATERLSGVIVVPPEAVSQSPRGATVFVVGGEGKALARVVTLGPVLEEGQVILDGLEAGARVVVNGQVALRDGARVEVQAPGDEAR